MANEPRRKKERIGPVEEVTLLRYAACDWRLSRGDVATYGVLLEHSDDNYTSFPGPVLIGSKAHLSVPNVRKSLDKLEAWGYIEILRGHRVGDARRGESFNRYELGEMPFYPPKPETRCNFKASRTRIARNPSSSDGTHIAGNASSAQSDERTDIAHDREPVLPAIQTRIAGSREPVLPAIHEYAFESTLEIASEITAPPVPAFMFEQQQREQQEKLEQERLAEEERKTKEQDRRESLRAEYLQSKLTHPAHAAMMEKLFHAAIADLIEEPTS